MKKKNTKIGILYALIMLILIVGGFMIGFRDGNILSEEEVRTSSFTLFNILTLFIALIVSFIGHIVIHECGHLITGKLSGYRFLFFRLFKWTILKKDDKLTWTHISIAGTGGQCLMLPPQDTLHPPYFFYLIGGVLANALTAGLAIIIYVWWWPSSILIIFAMMGFISCAINGIPSGFNDGMTIKKIRANSIVRDQLMQQLEWTGKFTTGATYREFDKEEIIYNPHAPLTEQSNVYGKLIEINSYLEKGYLKEAKGLLQPLWDKKEDIVGPYQIEIIREYVFCHLLLGEDEENNAFVIDEALNNPFFSNYIQSSQTDSYRIHATLAWYKDKDKEKALEWLNKARKKCEKALLTVEKAVNTPLLDCLEYTLLS